MNNDYATQIIKNSIENEQLILTDQRIHLKNLKNRVTEFEASIIEVQQRIEALEAALLKLEGNT